MKLINDVSKHKTHSEYSRSMSCMYLRPCLPCLQTMPGLATSLLLVPSSLFSCTTALWAGGQGRSVGETQGAQGRAAHNSGEVYREIDKIARRPLNILLLRNVKCPYAQTDCQWDSRCDDWSLIYFQNLYDVLLLHQQTINCLMS